MRFAAATEDEIQETAASSRCAARRMICVALISPDKGSQAGWRPPYHAFVGGKSSWRPQQFDLGQYLNEHGSLNP